MLIKEKRLGTLLFHPSSPSSRALRISLRSCCYCHVVLFTPSMLFLLALGVCLLLSMSLLLCLPLRFCCSGLFGHCLLSPSFFLGRLSRLTLPSCSCDTLAAARLLSSLMRCRSCYFLLVSPSLLSFTVHFSWLLFSTFCWHLLSLRLTDSVFVASWLRSFCSLFVHALFVPQFRAFSLHVWSCFQCLSAL